MVASLGVPLPSSGFTQIPNSVLLNTSLSRDARFLYSILMQHGRASSGYKVFPSYARLCLLMDVSEPTARKAMNELRGAGLVMQERRGQGKSNRYHLLVRPKDSFVQDQNVERVEEHEEKEHQEIPFEDSIAKLSIVVSLEARETTKQPSAHDSSSLPLPPPQLDEARMAIFPYMKDIGREMHDEASLTSTVTRTVRIFHRSGVSLEAFQMHLLLARQKTQERSASIKKVGANGMKNKVPYWFKVLETSLGLVDSPQSSDFSSSPYPRSQSGTAYFTANHTNPMVQGTRDFWNDRE